MITTFQALAVTLLALLPGASYTFAYERVIGNFRVSFTDRLVRFTAASALFAALFSGPAFLLYRAVIVNGKLGRGSVNPVYLELVALAYVLVPIGVGALLGAGQRCHWRWVALFVGGSPEPRAWDYIWSLRVAAVVRVKLKSGTWLAGMFNTNQAGQRSFAAGYPEKEDLYLSQQLKVDPVSGEFARDPDGTAVPVDGGGGLLLRWDEIEFLEFKELPST